MEIRIVLDEVEPPSGHLERIGGEDGGGPTGASPFTGWLGLLRALSTVMGHPNRLSGQ
ncbi:MAG: hypothetical protein WB797_11095 [Nocardioides sp.]